jgi:hypothetical protein
MNFEQLTSGIEQDLTDLFREDGTMLGLKEFNPHEAGLPVEAVWPVIGGQKKLIRLNQA